MKIVPWREFLELADAREIPEELGRFDGDITSRQKERLHKLGIGWNGLNKYTANIVIRIVEERKNKGLATPGQMQMLRKLSRSNVSNVSFNDARQIIGDSFHW